MTTNNEEIIDNDYKFEERFMKLREYPCINGVVELGFIEFENKKIILIGDEHNLIKSDCVSSKIILDYITPDDVLYIEGFKTSEHISINELKEKLYVKPTHVFNIHNDTSDILQYFIHKNIYIDNKIININTRRGDRLPNDREYFCENIYKLDSFPFINYYLQRKTDYPDDFIANVIDVLKHPRLTVMDLYALAKMVYSNDQNIIVITGANHTQNYIKFFNEYYIGAVKYYKKYTYNRISFSYFDIDNIISILNKHPNIIKKMNGYNYNEHLLYIMLKSDEQLDESTKKLIAIIIKTIFMKNNPTFKLNTYYYNSDSLFILNKKPFDNYAETHMDKLIFTHDFSIDDFLF